MRKLLIGVAGAGALALALSGCVPNQPASAALTVDVKDDACVVSQNTAETGAITFEITNSGTDVNEFEILAEDKLRIVGEKENVTPGQTISYVAQLAPGTYYTACKFQLIGAPIGLAEFTVTGDAVADAPAALVPVVVDEVGDTAATITPAEEAAPANLVGYGAGGHGASRRRRGPAAGHAPAAAIAVPVSVARAASVPAAAASVVIAKPPIRKLAKDLGVDLTQVTATGLVGEVTRDDVVRQASQASVFKNIQTPEWGDEREEIIPVKGMRKAIATAMVSSKFTAPHVSVFVDVDATRTMEFVKRLKSSPDFAGIRVSPLLIAAKALI